ncbi:MAG: outer membrane protein assembly factor BamA [Deltaproteobacteria bacterium]|nr:outer membrane protein assembly factor BamA [Deltaproteobacteria bacterium]
MNSTAISRIGLILAFLVILVPVCLAPGPSCSEESGKRPSGDTRPVISRIVIDTGEPAVVDGTLRETARTLIFLKEGEPFSDDRLKDSIDALAVSQMFEEIHADSKEEADGLALLFRLTPMRRIKEITVDGHYPLFERDILNAISIHGGVSFVRKDIPRQAELIAALYERQGFIGPKVAVTVRENGGGTVDIHITIETDAYYSLDSLDMEGNRAFSDGRLKFKMKSWRAAAWPGSSGRFVGEDFTKDMKALLSFYRGKGYADAAIEHGIDKNPQTGVVTSLITIDEGLFYDIRFSGNKEFLDWTLRKDLVLFETGNRNGLGLKKTVKKIKERYRQAGYLDARISIVEETNQEDKRTDRTITIVIDEGAQSIVRSIEIAGNSAFDDKKIRKQMITGLTGIVEKVAYVPEELEKDVLAISSLYVREGYASAVIEPSVRFSDDRKAVDINLAVTEGVRTVVSSVSIEGAGLMSGKAAHEALMLNKGAPFRSYMVRSDKNILAQRIAEKGYPHVAVQTRTAMSEDGSDADITYRVDEGPYVRMGQTYFTGNFRTRDKVLRNELELKPGDPFSLSKMLEQQKNIRDMGVFNTVRFKTIGLKEKADTVNLIAEVEEKKPYYFEFGGGYESDSGFTAKTGAGDRNLFGSNKHGWISGQASQVGYRGDLGLAEPRLFGTKTGLSLNLFAERIEKFNQDFGTKTYGTSAGLSRKVLPSLTAGFALTFEQKDQYSLVSAGKAARTDEFQSRSILVTTPSITYDTRDSFVRPKKGMFSTVSVDVSAGLRNSLDNFLKYRLDARYFVTPVTRLTIALLGRGGYISTYGSDGTIPKDQLFYLGGTSDVRGFDENLLRYDRAGNPVGGTTALSGSIEARIDLGHNVEFAPFYDTGSVRHAAGDSGSDSFRSSAGVALRYITPIGPIGLAYGHKLDRREGESAGRFHFAIGYMF